MVDFCSQTAYNVVQNMKLKKITAPFTISQHKLTIRVGFGDKYGKSPFAIDNPLDHHFELVRYHNKDHNARYCCYYNNIDYYSNSSIISDIVNGRF